MVYEPLHPGQARRIVALAFMNIVAAWEEFVQGTFIRYMAGASSGNGYKPRLRFGPSESLAHAGQILSGKKEFGFQKDYFNWSSWKDVLSRAELFFSNGEPYSNVPEKYHRVIKDAFIIRNRIAHSSRKCRSEFNSLARRYLGLRKSAKLPQGYSVGNVLVEPNVRGFSKNHSPVDYFSAFCEIFTEIADISAP